MNIINSTVSSNPYSEILASASTQVAGRSLVDMVLELRSLALNAAEEGKSLDSVERAAWSLVLQMGREAIELFIRGQGTGDLGPTLTGEDEQCLVRSEAPVNSTIRTVFGTHRFQQFAYSEGPKTKVQLYPISARMHLPDAEWSNLLQEFSQRLCVDQAYSQASENLSAFLGGKFSVDTLESTNQHMGIHAGEFMSHLPAPPKAEEGKILDATLDGKGIPMRKPASESPLSQSEKSADENTAKKRKPRAKALAKAKRRAAFEDALLRPGNRRMATVASVYTVDPFQRTAEQIVAALFRDPKTPSQDDQPSRPRPTFKHTTAHLPNCYDDVEGMIHTSGICEAAAWCEGQLTPRRRAGQKVIVLLDGQIALLEEMEKHLGENMIPILDIIHVSSYVWDASKALYATRPEQLAFVRSRLLEILKGRSPAVVKGIRRMATLRKIKGEKRKTIDRACNYIESNEKRMRYDEYLKNGYPIATGVIEGACGHLVKDRMERSGMRWIMEGARSMLNVRAAFQSDYWTECCESYARKNQPDSKTLQWLGNYQPACLAA